MHRRTGFTLIEMCLGMAITALIATAIASFSLAVSQNWQNERHSQRLSLGAEIVAERIRNAVQSAILVGGCKTGSLTNGNTSAGILFWVGDTNADGLVQGNETAMLYYDPSLRQLRWYTGSASETATWSYSSAFVLSGSVDAYCNGRNSTILANNVAAFSVESSGNSADSTSSVAIAFELSVPDGSKAESIVHYCRAFLRAPAAIPGN